MARAPKAKVDWRVVHVQDLTRWSTYQEHRDNDRKYHLIREKQPETQNDPAWRHDHCHCGVPVLSSNRFSRSDSPRRWPNHHVFGAELRMQWVRGGKLHIHCLSVQRICVDILLLPWKRWTLATWRLLHLDTPIRQQRQEHASWPARSLPCARPAIVMPRIDSSRNGTEN